MPKSYKNLLILWLLSVSVLVLAQITLGGYVRLTKSGLSMYDWHVITGVVPPLTEKAWQETFENYKKTPEYKKVNVGMGLADYKSIYYREYNHRILGRFSGILYVVPLFIFLFAGVLKWRQSISYLIIGLLYAAQGAMGWYMVKSGLVDAPHVSPFRLAAHLLLALLILAMLGWEIYNLTNGKSRLKNLPAHCFLSRRTLVFSILLTLQIIYGAFMAGLKAGHVSNTYPFMMGYLVPPGMFSGIHPTWLNIFENSLTVHFIHRWLAFVVAGFGIYIWHLLRNSGIPRVRSAAQTLGFLLVVQLLLGISVVLWDVAITLALVHQLTAAFLVLTVAYILHGLSSDRSVNH